MSEEMSMFGQASSVDRDSAHPGHREIPISHGPQTSIDELLKVIKGANGMPVLFVPTSDGRLAAVAIDGLQSLMPAKREGSDPVEKKEKALRSWLFLLTSLVATATFTAGLTPPGGFWQDDNGHVAGTPIMEDKSGRRYSLFQYFNTSAFFTSLSIIAALAMDGNINKKIMTKPFNGLVGLCFLWLGASFIAGTWDNNAGFRQLWTVVYVLAINIAYMWWDRIEEMFSST